jgi:hypothetical protein
MSSGSSSDDPSSENDRDLPDALYGALSDDDVPLPSEIGVKSEDLEDPPGSPEKRTLEEILERVRRIEEQLEKSRPQVPESRERRSLEDMFSELIDVLRRMDRRSDEISDLRKRMRRVERIIHRTSSIGEGKGDSELSLIVHRLLERSTGAGVANPSPRRGLVRGRRKRVGRATGGGSSEQVVRKKDVQSVPLDPKLLIPPSAGPQPDTPKQSSKPEN